MVSTLQRRIALRRKLHILRRLAFSNSMKRSSIITDAILYICKLKLKLEEIKRELSILDAIKREHLSLLNQIQHLPKVKVEKAGNGFLVKVTCQEGGDNLVPILEVLEEMGLVVLHAKVSCNVYFDMEAIVVAEEEEEEENGLNVKNVTEALVNAIVRHVEKDRNIKAPVVDQ